MGPCSCPTRDYVLVHRQLNNFVLKGRVYINLYTYVQNTGFVNKYQVNKPDHSNLAVFASDPAYYTSLIIPVVL